MTMRFRSAYLSVGGAIAQPQQHSAVEAVNHSTSITVRLIEDEMPVGFAYDPTRRSRSERLFGTP